MGKSKLDSPDVKLFHATTVEEAQKALDEGGDPNQHGSSLSLLHWAAIHRTADLVSFLIEHGANVNVCDSHNWTPLHYASCGYAQQGVAEALVAHGADVNAKSDTMYTPLHVAAYNNRADCVRLYLEHGANVKAKTAYGDTALKIARGEKNKEAIDAIRAHNAKMARIRSKKMKSKEMKSKKGEQE